MRITLPIRFGEVTARVRLDKWATFWLCVAGSRVCDFLGRVSYGDLLREAAWRATGLEVVEDDETQTC
jgi:hypothetical protein